MKNSNQSAAMIFLSLFLLLTDSKEAVCQNSGKQIIDKRISESAKGTKVDTSIIKAALQRDSVAAEKLKNDYIESKKKKNESPVLEPREISDILVLDYDQPELHIQLAESSLEEYVKKDQGKDLKNEALELIWQELEWLKTKNVSDSLKERISKLRKNLPSRPTKDTVISKEILASARKTFQSGKPIYIYYPDKKPIIFEAGSGFFNAINAPTTYIRYIRSPQYPPSGCRVVTYMLVSKDGKEVEPQAFNQGYEACILPTGMLKSFYLAIGTPKLQPNTKLFIHIESLFDTKEGKEAVIISNTIAIPVVLKK